MVIAAAEKHRANLHVLQHIPQHVLAVPLLVLDALLNEGYPMPFLHHLEVDVLQLGVVIDQKPARQLPRFGRREKGTPVAPKWAHNGRIANSTVYTLYIGIVCRIHTILGTLSGQSSRHLDRFNPNFAIDSSSNYIECHSNQNQTQQQYLMVCLKRLFGRKILSSNSFIFFQCLTAKSRTFCLPISDAVKTETLSIPINTLPNSLIYDYQHKRWNKKSLWHVVVTENM